MEVDIYGYSSRSVPGLDIIGLGGRGKLIREKINFITNRYVPKKKSLKKYVISVEADYPEEKLKVNSNDLEFPILILYWAMAAIIPIKNLDRCWASGKVNVDFEVISPLIEKVRTLNHNFNWNHEKILICTEQNRSPEFGNILVWEDLLTRVYKNNGQPSNDGG
jgi:hypothetical protein